MDHKAIDKNDSLVRIVECVKMFYSDQGLKNFRPSLNNIKKYRGKESVNPSKAKKHAEMLDEALTARIDYSFCDVKGHEKLDTVLKKAISFEFKIKPKQTVSELSELKKFSELLKTQIISLSKDSNNTSKVDELKQTLDSVTETIDGMEPEDENQRIDYNYIAMSAIKILAKNNNKSKKLYDMIIEAIVPTIVHHIIDKNESDLIVETRENWRSKKKIITDDTISIEPSSTTESTTTRSFRHEDRQNFKFFGRSDRSERGIGRCPIPLNEKHESNDKKQSYLTHTRYLVNKSTEPQTNGKYIPPYLRKQSGEKVDVESDAKLVEKSHKDVDKSEVRECVSRSTVKPIGAWVQKLSTDVFKSETLVEEKPKVIDKSEYNDFRAVIESVDIKNTNNATKKEETLDTDDKNDSNKIKKNWKVRSDDF